MSSYTPEVEAAFHLVPNPDERFILDIAEDPRYPGLIILQFYAPNIIQFNQFEKTVLGAYVYACRDAIRNTGAQCEIRKVDENPHADEAIRRVRDKIKRYRETYYGM